MNRLVLIILLGVLTLIPLAHAQSLSSIERLPDNYEQLAFKIVGKAKFSVLFWDIYNSSLYTKSGRYLNNSATVLFKIEYLKDITADDLLDRTIQQWQHLQRPKSQFSPYISKLKAIWPDISAGDSLTLLVADKKSIFYFNEQFIGVIEEQEFSQLFLDIWLSPNTSQADLRESLLEGNKL